MEAGQSDSLCNYYFVTSDKFTVVAVLVVEVDNTGFFMEASTGLRTKPFSALFQFFKFIAESKSKPAPIIVISSIKQKTA